MNIFPGKMVLYIWRPGQVRARQSESAAMITRINPDGTVNLKIEPDGTPDPVFQNNIAMRSDAVQSHCWKPNADDVERDELIEHIADLERRLVHQEGGAVSPVARQSDRKSRKAA